MTQDELLTDHLQVTAQLAYHWQALEMPPDAAMLARLDHRNAQVLQTMLALQEHFPDSGEYSTESNLELARLDLKINLLFELMGELIRRQIELPLPASLSLSAHAARWLQPSMPSIDESGLLSIYFHPSLPRPVELAVTVTEVRAIEAGHEAGGFFQGVSLGVKEQLEKLIFRLHRKAVARSRHPI